MDAIEELAQKKAKRVKKSAKKSRGKHRFETWKVAKKLKIILLNFKFFSFVLKRTNQSCLMKCLIISKGTI